jgi:hypothetical protein
MATALRLSCPVVGMTRSRPPLSHGNAGCEVILLPFQAERKLARALWAKREAQVARLGARAPGSAVNDGRPRGREGDVRPSRMPSRTTAVRFAALSRAKTPARHRAEGPPAA